MHKRHEAEIKVRVRRNPWKALRKLFLVVIALYVIFMVGGFVRDMVFTRLAKAEALQEGVIQSGVTARGIVVRNEQTVLAPRTGTLKVIAAEGERVRVGELVAQVVAASLDTRSGEAVFNITAPQAGLVSYHLDGLEGIYSPQNIKELDLTKIDTLKSEAHHYLPGGQVEEGKPVLKIVNNLDPVSIIAVTDTAIKTRDDGSKSLLVSLGQDGSNPVRASVQEAPFQGKPDQILFNLDNYDQTLLTQRKISFKIITDRYEGYIIPTGALVRKQGIDGIFTVYKERVKWKKVEVVGRVQEKVAISGITPDIKVIVNPEYVKEGRPFRVP